MTAAVLALNTAVDKSRKEMTHSLARSPDRVCSRAGNLCLNLRLKYDCDSSFLHIFFAIDSLVSRYLSFISCTPSPCQSLSLFRVSSSVQQLIYVRLQGCFSGNLFLMSHFVVHFVLVFSLSYLACFLVFSYPARWRFTCFAI